MDEGENEWRFNSDEQLKQLFLNLSEQVSLLLINNIVE